MFATTEHIMHVHFLSFAAFVVTQQSVVECSARMDVNSISGTMTFTEMKTRLENNG